MFRPPSVGQRLHILSSHARRMDGLDVLAVHGQGLHPWHQRRRRLLLLPRLHHAVRRMGETQRRCPCLKPGPAVIGGFTSCTHEESPPCCVCFWCRKQFGNSMIFLHKVNGAPARTKKLPSQMLNSAFYSMCNARKDRRMHSLTNPYPSNELPCP